jgi:hypothetical protein
MDHQLRDVTVIQYRRALLQAAERVGVIQPEALREPVSLWLRAAEAEARSWRSLLGRSVVSAWNAAQAILTASDT